MSATHSWLGAAAVKFRAARSGAVAVEIVRRPYLPRRRRCAPSIAPRRISRATRLRGPGVPASAHLRGQPAGTVDAAGLDPRGSRSVYLIGLLQLGLGRTTSPIGPGIEGGGADPEHPAETAHAVGPLLRGDELADQAAAHRPVSRAKKTAAFSGSPARVPARRPCAAAGPARGVRRH